MEKLSSVPSDIKCHFKLYSWKMCSSESYSMSFVGITGVLYAAIHLRAKLDKTGWGNRNDGKTWFWSFTEGKNLLTFSQSDKIHLGSTGSCCRFHLLEMWYNTTSVTELHRSSKPEKPISVELRCKPRCSQYLPFTRFACEGADLLSTCLQNLPVFFKAQNLSIVCTCFHLELRKIGKQEEI